MRKFKFLLFIAALALTMSGVGYAAWNDSLTVAATASTGEVNIQFVNDGSYNLFRGDKYVIPSAKITDKNAHSMEFSVDNMYPGSWAMFKVKGINSGTIPVKFENMDVKFSGDEELKNYLTFESGLTVYNDNCKRKAASFSVRGNLRDFASEFNKEINKYEKIVMEPNGSGSFFLGVPYDNAGDIENKGLKDDYIIIKMSEDAPNDTNGKSLHFTITMNFQQCN